MPLCEFIVLYCLVTSRQLGAVCLVNGHGDVVVELAVNVAILSRGRSRNFRKGGG